MSLYTVRFTTRKEVTKYDGKGKPIETIITDVPVTLHHLPLSTAQSYAHCSNYACEREFMDHSAAPAASYRRKERPVFDPNEVRRPAKSSSGHMPRPTANRPKTNAAATGDMSAAINQ